MPQRERRQRREEGGKGIGDAAKGVGMKRKEKAARPESRSSFDFGGFAPTLDGHHRISGRTE